MQNTNTHGRPTLVTVAAVLLGLIAVWRFAVKVVPAVMAAEPAALGEFVSVTFSVAVVVGLLALQRWAWWIAVIMTGVVAGITLAVLGSFDRIPVPGDAADHATIVRVLSVLGAVCAVIFGCLIAPSSRAAFRNKA